MPCKPGGVEVVVEVAEVAEILVGADSGSTAFEAEVVREVAPELVDTNIDWVIVGSTFELVNVVETVADVL